MKKSKDNFSEKNIIKTKDIDAVQKSIKEIKSPLLKLTNFKLIKKEYALTEQDLTPIIVLQKLSEHAELYIKIIQQILQPEEFHSMYECSVFSEAEKQALLELYKKIMYLHRELLKSEIINEEENMLLTIKKVHEELFALKPSMLKIVIKMQDSWDANSKNASKTKSAQYFG
jgi:hypothetical protein